MQTPQMQTPGYINKRAVRILLECILVFLLPRGGFGRSPLSPSEKSWSATAYIVLLIPSTKFLHPVFCFPPQLFKVDKIEQNALIIFVL